MLAFEVPPSTFMREFGSPVVFGSQRTTAILDMPTEEIVGHMVLSVDYKLTFPSADLPGLDAGSSLTVSAASYTVRSVRQLGDGVFSEAILSKS